MGGLAERIVAGFFLAVIVGIIVTNPTGDSAVINSLSAAANSGANALHVQAG